VRAECHCGSVGASPFRVPRRESPDHATLFSGIPFGEFSEHALLVITDNKMESRNFRFRTDTSPP